MASLKFRIAKNIAEKFFSKEVKELRESYYREEKTKVGNEIKRLSSSLNELQNEYRELQNKKFGELVQSDLSKQQTREEVKNNDKENSPFSDLF